MFSENSKDFRHGLTLLHSAPLRLSLRLRHGRMARRGQGVRELFPPRRTGRSSRTNGLRALLLLGGREDFSRAAHRRGGSGGAAGGGAMKFYPSFLTTGLAALAMAGLWYFFGVAILAKLVGLFAQPF